MVRSEHIYLEAWSDAITSRRLPELISVIDVMWRHGRRIKGTPEHRIAFPLRGDTAAELEAGGFRPLARKPRRRVRRPPVAAKRSRSTVRSATASSRTRR